MNEPGLEISVVVPVYREESNIEPFLHRLEPVLDGISPGYEILFCLDPSPDNTETEIIRHIERNPNIRLLVFSRRFGQPAATMAGILASNAKTCVVIDVDLQDQPELISDLHRNTGDFRIMTRRVVEELRRLNESHGFLRGLVAYVGFKQTFIQYDRDERFTGRGNYSRLTGSLRIGLNGLISFSSRPLQLMSIAGFFLAMFSFLLGLVYAGQKLFGVNLTPGLSTTVIVVTFFSGVQLFGLGLIGEYVGRIYDEVKRRPMYIVDRKVNFDSRQP